MVGHLVGAHVLYLAALEWARFNYSCVAVSYCTLGARVLVRLYEWRGVWFPVWRGPCQEASLDCRLPCFSECSLVTYLRKLEEAAVLRLRRAKPCV